MRAVVLLAVASTLALAGVAGLSLIPGFGPTVKVTQVNIDGAGACGPGSQTAGGFSLPATGEEQFSSATVIEYCVIESITSGTAGFTVVSANTPYVTGHESQPLEWTVQGPLSFHGQLTFFVNGAMSASTSNPTNGTACSLPQCPTTHIPSGLYQFRFGEVLPGAWIMIGAISLGAALGLVGRATYRRD